MSGSEHGKEKEEEEEDRNQSQNLVHSVLYYVRGRHRRKHVTTNKGSKMLPRTRQSLERNQNKY